MSNEQRNKRKRRTTTVIQTNEKSANSVSITNSRTDVTDGTLPEGAIIMQ